MVIKYWFVIALMLAFLVTCYNVTFAQSDRPSVPDVYCMNGQVHLVWDTFKYRVIISGMRCQQDGGDEKQPGKKQDLTAGGQ